MKKRVISILLGAIATLTLGVSFPKEVHADWKKDNIGWYYQDNNSYYTGWKLIDNNWYYFYSDGYMATNDKIGDYFVNSTGAWTNEITADEARELIYNEDGNYLTKILNDGVVFSDRYFECETNGYKPYSEKAWEIPKEPMYWFDLLTISYDISGNPVEDAFGSYLVGKESKNVYAFPNQGGMSVYQIQDNKKIKTYKCLDCRNSHEWR